MTIKPLADRVLIEPKEAETKTASGIFIPDTAKEKPQQGKVVAVGNGKKMNLWSLKWVTMYFMANTQVQRSQWMVKAIL